MGSNPTKRLILLIFFLATPQAYAEIGEISVQAGPPAAASPTRSTDPSALRFQVQTRVTLLVVDSKGRRTGYDPKTDRVLQEIPNSKCDVDFVPNRYTGAAHWEAYERLAIEPAPKGLYSIRVSGLQDGPFEINISALSNQGSSEPSKQVEGLISEGENKSFQLTFDPNPDQPLSVVEQPTSR